MRAILGSFNWCCKNICLEANIKDNFLIVVENESLRKVKFKTVQDIASGLVFETIN